MSEKNVVSSLEIAEDCFRQILEHPAAPFELKKAARFGLYDIETYRLGEPERERTPQWLKDELAATEATTGDREITAREAAELAHLANNVVALEEFLPEHIHYSFIGWIDDMYNHQLASDVDYNYINKAILAHCNDLNLVPTFASESISIDSESAVADALVALLDSPYTPSNVKTLLNTAVVEMNAAAMSDVPEALASCVNPWN